MWNWLRGCWKYLREIYKPSGLWVAAVIGLIGVASSIKQEMALTPAQQQQWAFLKFVPATSWYWWVIGALVAALIVAWCRGYDAYKVTTRFFADRAELKPGGLQNELLSTGEVWAIWPSGYVVPQLSREALGHIKRLILGSPNENLADLQTYAAEYLVGSADHVREVIQEATRSARKSDVPVRWLPSRNQSVVIGDPFSTTGKGWARIELLLPYTHASNRPSVLITQLAQPRLFANLVQMYDCLWKAANEPTDQSVGVVSSTELKVHKARYGFGDDPTKWRDVTFHLVSQVLNDRIDFVVTNQALNCEGPRDPFPSQKKFLEVEYTIAGVRKISVTKEKQRLVLPPN